ncbi:MAG: nucleotidyltransferase family protein [Acidimicrobiales bacterium]
MTVTGLVLAAGSSNRLGRPKQLLPFRGRTLLDASLELARACPFDQLLVTLGAAAGDVRDQVDLAGVEVVESPAPTAGCSSSIVAALAHVDEAADGLVLLLGDQPGVTVAAVEALLREGARSPLAVIRYDDGVGHPVWVRRDVFAELATLHGDKAVWKLVGSGRFPVTEVRMAGPVPLDVDTEEDYEALLAGERVS